ncbi:MAG: hypothetical protein COB24_09265 [Hyphomicrobiales bacterium]|nr:MAG: hypothetical protein COB24_09265 [Hyphomicrobiales bacterium]
MSFKFGFSLFLLNFFAFNNLLSLIRSVSSLGIMALALVVISRGGDVSMITVLVVSIAWAFVLTRSGLPFGFALLMALYFQL